MRGVQDNRVLSKRSAEDFIGRTESLERVLQHARQPGQSGGLVAASQPGSGVSEVLRQSYDRLFAEGGTKIPFYFSFEFGESPLAAARRFVHEFIRQTVAFRRRDPAIISSAAGFAELSELAPPADGHWVDRLIEVVQRKTEPFEERAFLELCFSGPIRAAAEEAPSFVILDSLHHLAETDFRRIGQIYDHADLSYIFAGRRRSLSRLGNLPKFIIPNFDVAGAGRLIEKISQRTGVALNDECRDLIAIQLDGNPRLIEIFMNSAANTGAALDNFENVQRVYTDAVFYGEIKETFDFEVEQAAHSHSTQQALISLLYDSISSKEPVPADSWRPALHLDELSFHQLLRTLHYSEIIDRSGYAISPTESLLVGDYISAGFRVSIVGENKTLAFANALAEFIKRSPDLMSRYYRDSAALGIGDMLRTFRSQQVPAALIDYGKFENQYKGAPDAEILNDLRGSSEKILLPKVFFVADTVDLYRPIEIVTERNRSAVAFGFEKAGEIEEIDSVWLAAEIDSKLEAGKEIVEFWCDRLEMAAEMCDFRNYRIWLVAPEGFAPDALQVLRRRDAIGSSKKQFELLRRFIGSEIAETGSREYEIILPIGEDAELIAAHAAEDIAKRHNFDPHAINQIKTALVEACINAAEHSLSPDGKIYQKIRIDEDKIVITVSNRGLRLAGRQSPAPTPEGGRRGWGLTLMRRLMDNVDIENVDDGTRISMTKYLKPTD